MPNKKSNTPKTLTPFGKYLADRSVNKSDVCRKVGISLTRLNRLCYDEKSFLRAYELQLIAKAINVGPCKMQNDLFGHLGLKEEISPSEKIIANITNGLTENKLVDKHNLTLQEIKRIAAILPFIDAGKTDDEILKHVGLQRKSPKFQVALKAAIEAGWLTLHQRHKEGNVVNTYTTTAQGKEIVSVEEETTNDD
ncbi:helix-turn-helix domain-containing protein [Parapedobacter deserti]|uniref:Helix-turn-helix domain-containing protein n=1 Tax=Parapedobacter deserti TaxID=1912957 RepID=A0ABV7JJ46_9SPHI